MKIMTKRFLVAVCLLVVSATLLGSASFAWFSMNTDVNVDGIEVEAYSDALFLEISETGADDSYDTAITLADAKKTLRVVTQKKLANGYRITEVNFADAQDVEYVDGTFYVTTSDTTYVTGTTYYEPGFEPVTTLVNGDDVSELFVASGNVYVQAGDKVYNEEENVTYYKETFSVVDTATFDATTPVDEYYEAFDEIYVKGKATGTATDTYVAKNYIVASYTDATSVATLYKNPTITKIVRDDKYNRYVAATGTYDAGVEYYAYSNGAYAPLTITSDFVEGETNMSAYYVINPAEYYTVGTMAGQHTYTKVTNLADGASLKGYYTISGATQYAGALYDGTSSYYKKDAQGNFALVTNLDEAESLTGLYAIKAEELVLSNLAGIDDEVDTESIVVYTKDAYGYSYVGEYNEGDDISNKIYWARAYSAASDDYEAATPLNFIKSDFEKYYYLKKTVYLRNAANTNDATNLKIEDVIVKGPETDFNKALSILFVATSTSGETKVVEFKNSAPEAIENTLLFDKLLGNKQETVTLEMYFYFDGEYEEVMTANVPEIAGQSIEIKFSIDGPDYN